MPGVENSLIGDEDVEDKKTIIKTDMIWHIRDIRLNIITATINEFYELKY